MIELDLQAGMSSAPILALPLDQRAGSFRQSSNDPRNDFFDQYLNFDTVNLDGSVYLTAPASTLMVSPSNGFDFESTSSTKWKDEAGQNIMRRSRGEAPRHQNAASPQRKSKGNAFHSGELGRAAGSDLDLLSLEKISLQSPRLKSPPSSPQLHVAKTLRGRRGILEGFHKPFHNETESRTLRKSSPIRKSTCPAKMTCRSQHAQENIHDWDHRLALDAHKFNFDFQHTGPLSPPPSARASASSENKNYMLAATQQYDGTFAWDHPISQQYAYRTTEDIESPLTTPPVDVITFHQSNFQDPSPNNILYIPSHRNQSLASWAQTPLTSEYTFEDSMPYFDEPESPLRWRDAAPAHLAEPSPGYQRPSQHNSKSLPMQLQAELAYNANELALSPSSMPSGLMIQMPNGPVGQSSVMVASPMDQEQGYFAPSAAASLPHQPHNHRHTQSQPQSLPHNYAPLNPQQEKAHSRSKSISSSPSPRSRASSSHISKKRSFSRKRADPTGGQRTPKTGNNAGMKADFVNFTPSDSTQILMGVAPSGSSKTKARREKEAMEKTRRLSQAAVRAVQAAGGSIDSLVEEGLFDAPPGLKTLA